MQIHELNNFTGELGSGTFLAVDNGNDTGKVSVSGLLANTEGEINALDTSLNARIDNIIAGGAAPSEAEIIDARRGGDGVDYTSLGAAIRGQYTELNDSVNQLRSIHDIKQINFPFSYSGYISSTGTYVSSSNANNTGYIAVEEGDVFTIEASISSAGASVACFDKDRAFMSSESKLGYYQGNFLIPADVKFIIVSYYGAPGTNKCISVPLDDIAAPIKLTIPGYYISLTGGLNTNPEYSVSEFFPCDKNSTIVVRGCWAGASSYVVAYYDSDKTFISGIASVYDYYKADTIPNNAAYVRFGSRITGMTGRTEMHPEIFLNNAIALLKDSNANPIAGAEVLIFGDSITSACDLTVNADDETTAYTWRNPSNSYVNAGGVTIQYSMWPKILKEAEPCGEIRNYARSGATYRTFDNRTGDDKRQNLQYQIEVALNDRTNPNGVFTDNNYVPEIVIFALGTNDGVPDDTYDSAMSKTVFKSDGVSIDVDATIAALDDHKFCESARKAYLRIKKAFPMAQIYCVLPIQRAGDDTNLGTLHTYLKQMADRYGCIIIDGTFDTGITRDFNIWGGLGTYLKDGLHPNEKGQNLLARAIIKSLKSNYMPFGTGFNA